MSVTRNVEGAWTERVASAFRNLAIWLAMVIGLVLLLHSAGKSTRAAEDASEPSAIDR